MIADGKTLRSFIKFSQLILQGKAGDQWGEFERGYWEAEKVPATEAGRLRGCPLRKRRCILYCAGLGAECITNFRPVS